MFLERFLWKPLRCSLKGLSDLFKERAFREELFIGFILWNISLWRLGCCPLQALLTLAWGLVLQAEGFNSAIETIVNLVSPGEHILAKKAKDIASAAVFLSVIYGLIIFAFCMMI